MAAAKTVKDAPAVIRKDEPKKKADSPPKVVVKNESVKEVKPKAEAKPKAEPKAESKPKTETKPKAEAKPKTEAKPKAEPKAEAKPKAEPKPKAESKPKEDLAPIEEAAVDESADEGKSDRTKRQFVTKHERGWQVRLEGSTKATKVFPTKLEAEAYAKELAKKQDTTVVRKKKDGKFQKMKY